MAGATECRAGHPGRSLGVVEGRGLEVLDGTPHRTHRVQFVSGVVVPDHLLDPVAALAGHTLERDGREGLPSESRDDVPAPGADVAVTLGAEGILLTREISRPDGHQTSEDGVRHRVGVHAL